MSRGFAAWLSCLMVGAVAASSVPAAPAAEKATEGETQPTFYIATDGNDGWSGKLASPNAEKTDGPFATLEKARDALRAIDRKAQRTPRVVLVRGGKYFLEKTFVLGPKDGGTRQAPVVYAAYPGEKPILSGGRKVTGWEPYKDHIFQCSLPGSKGGKWKFRRLFADGQPYFRARWPNLDPKDPFNSGWTQIEAPAEPDSRTAFRYKPGALPRRWAKPTEAEVNVFFGIDNEWGNEIIPVASIDRSSRTITLTRAGRDYDRPSWFWNVPYRAGARFAVENVLEELDQPGEWCLDSEEGKLYFWPPQGSVEGLEIVAPKLDRLIALERTAFVTIRGLTLTETIDGDDLHPGSVEGLGAIFSMQGTKYCGEAIHLNRAEWCRIEGNRLYATGGNGIYLQGYNARNMIRGNEIGYAGGCGVGIGGAWGFGDSMNADATPAHDHDLGLAESHLQYPLFNEIIGNDIHHCGEIIYYAAGVFAALSEDNVIGHNAIHDTPQHGINLGSSGMSRNIVEYNDFQRTCRRCGDTGAINCWADAQARTAPRQGHIIRYNRIVDPGGNGIYLDDYTSNCYVFGNLIVAAKDLGIHVHGGKNNVLENNVIVGARDAVGFADFVSGRTPEMVGFSMGNRFCHNIVVGCRREPSCGTTATSGPTGRSPSRTTT